MRSIHHLILLACLATTAHAADRPNILLVTADDLGCQLSCYGEKRIATPQLDALAAGGVRFNHAYVSQSSCSSSRASLLTGRWPHQNGQIGLAHLGFTMQPGQPNLPALLKSAGYRTGIVGKLHVEPAAEFPFDWMPKEKVAAGPTRNVQWVAEQCRTFFASAKAAKQPFFHYVNFFDPHGPFTKETDQVGGIPEKPLRPGDITDPLPLKVTAEPQRKALTARILNTILRIDVGMGLLLDELERAGCASNTIVVFVGDNGLAVPRGKTTCYEQGVRVPMFIRWPGQVRAGLASEALVSLLDITPTLLEAAGVKCPEGLAGETLRPLLAGEGRGREFLFTEMNFHEPDILHPQRTVRDARYKLLHNLLPAGDQPAVELFDLQADPGETNNLAGLTAVSDAQARLETALAKWQQETHDPLLDAARLQRWQVAREAWSKLPRIETAAAKVVRIPAGDLERLK